MADYLPRLVDPLIDELFAELPALLLVGPQATGHRQDHHSGAACDAAPISTLWA